MMSIKDLVKLRNQYHKAGNMGGCAFIDTVLKNRGYKWNGEMLPWRKKLGSTWYDKEN